MGTTTDPTTVTIIPGRMATLATALRGHINTSLAYSRTGDADMLEESIKCMRRDMTRLEAELRQVCNG